LQQFDELLQQLLLEPLQQLDEPPQHPEPHLYFKNEKLKSQIKF
jgi:hypothetical protein